MENLGVEALQREPDQIWIDNLVACAAEHGRETAVYNNTNDSHAASSVSWVSIREEDDEEKG